MTQRTERLKAKLFEIDDRVLFLERMEIIKECDEKYKDYTAGLKFGYTLNDLLAQITIVIDDDDLIVGRVPETLPTEAQERWFEANRQYFYVPWFQSSGHLTISWERLLNEGLRGISKRARQQLAPPLFKGAGGIDQITGDDGVSLSRKDFLWGAMLSCDAIETYSQRYAQHAEELAEKTSDPNRRLELLRIAEVCRHVPTNPARTMHEAVQAVWLVDLVLHAVVGSRDFALGRIDQYLYPFYEKDLKEGRITPKGAQELIECLYIKCSEIIGYADQANARKRSLCQDSVQYVVLGGQTKDGNNPLTPFIKGEDATNPLSTIAVKAGYLKLKQPTIKIRYFNGINEEFWLEVCRLVRAGGSVGIYNDDVEIPAFTSVGVELADARNYVHYGCCNANVPGKEGSLMERWHSLPKYLELALNNGMDPLTGQQVGPKTGDITEFQSLDDLLEAFRFQVRHVLEAERASATFIRPEDHSQCSFTLESVFLDDCLENGREWRLGGTKYWHKSQHGCGIATIADSLAAIQKMVFDAPPLSPRMQGEEKELTLAELRDILNANFEGHEPLRQKLLNRCPKYGNDDDYVDSIAVRIGNIFCDEVLRCNEVPHSITFWPEIYTYHHNKGFGTSLGATPDGRKKGENISENQSPSYGMDIKGVTACLKSIAKLPTHRTPGGGTNLKIHPSAVAGETGLKALSNLLKTYFNEGGQHLQLNLLDSQTLKEAQQDPEQYKTLSVRVVGYSAYFVTLSKKVQDDIIERMEHTL